MRRRIVLTTVLVAVVTLLLVATVASLTDGRSRAALVVASFAAIVIAWLVGRRLAVGLAEPLDGLASAARRLGSGDPRPARRRYGIKELDAVAEELDVSARRIGEQLSAERRLAGDASHQLRTPLTALSMRLEEIIATDAPEVARAEAVIALQQVERLSGVVDDLLSFPRRPRETQAVAEVDPVLTGQADEWRGAYAAQGRSLVVTGLYGLAVRVSGGAVSQVVATLVENALVHGAGTTTVRTRTSGSSVVIEVSDQGEGVPPALARRIFERDVSGASRSGLGLAVARALIEVEGGRLELTSARPATFAVFLPAALVSAAPDPGDGTEAGGVTTPG